MTEKDLKAVYDKMSLSEDRISELEKRLDKCFEKAAHTAPKDFSDEELMHFDTEYKPAAKRRPIRAIIGSCAAVVAVAAVGLGAYTLYKNGMLPIVPKDTPTDAITPAETVITADMLPEYPNKGALDAQFNHLDYETSYADVCQDDWNFARISDTQLIAALTITDIYCGDVTYYTATVDKTYFNLLGYDISNCEIEFSADFSYQKWIMDFPPYYIGDRVLVALKTTDNGQFEISAAYAVADILTVDEMDYTAVRSDVLANLDITDYSNGQTITRTTTLTRNPVNYYGIYDVDSLGEYLAGRAEQSQKFEKPLNGMFSIDDLHFNRDEAGMSVFERYFLGRWKNSSDGTVLFSYTNDGSPDGRYYLCMGFAEDDNYAYMKIGAAESDAFTLYCINKAVPDEIYTYALSDAPEISRARYLTHYALSAREDTTDVTAGGYLGYFGRLKLQAVYNSESFTTAMDNVFMYGSADFDGRTWNRYYVRPDIFDLSAERDQLITMEPDHVAFTIRLYDSEARDFVTEPTNNYRERPVCRNFMVDMTDINGEWSYELTPLSGSTDDMSNFWSPLDNAEQYTSLRCYKLDNEKTVSVMYYDIPAENGMTAVYAVRQVADADNGDIVYYQLYSRDPVSDEYDLCRTLRTFSCIIDDGVFCYWGVEADGNSIACNINRRCYYLRDTEKSVSLYVRGDYLIAKRFKDSGVQWAVFDKKTMEYPVFYDENNLVLYDDDFTTFETEWIATNQGIVSIADENRNVNEVYHTGDEIYGDLLRIDSQDRSMWSHLVIGSADFIYTEYPKKISENGEELRYYQLADSKIRTREGMLEYLETVLTPDAAEEALQYLFTTYYREIDGQIYTTGGDRGADLSIGALVPNITSISTDKKSGELTYTIYYDSHDDEGNLLPETDSYTIPWELTENGIRLGKFFYPL